MTSFGTLNTGVTGLRAAQRAMDTAGQNITNATTPGYSRQKVQQSSIGAANGATFHTGTDNPIGGVRIDDVVRVRDAFLEATRAAAGSRLSALEAEQSTMSAAQRLLHEPGEAGLQAGMDGFFAAWHELSMNPSDGAAASTVVQNGIDLTDRLHTLANGIDGQWQETRTRLQDTVDKANQATEELARLNWRIADLRSGGQPVNEVMDQRDQLVRRLGELVGGYAVPGPDGQVSLSVNGITLVQGDVAQKLTLGGAQTLDGAPTDPPTVLWAGTAVPIETGAAAGHLATLRTGLPDLMNQVDAVASSMAEAVNAVHATGYTLSGAAGGPFFTGTGARDIALASTSTADIAMASAPNTLDGSVAARIGDLAADPASAAVLGGPGPSARYRELTSVLGARVQSLGTAQEVQQSVVNSAEDVVAADSGVNLDEEMTGMLMFQRAYQASARVITTVDEMLDTLINRTGTVGR